MLGLLDLPDPFPRFVSAHQLFHFTRVRERVWGRDYSLFTLSRLRFLTGRLHHRGMHIFYIFAGRCSYRSRAHFAIISTCVPPRVCREKSVYGIARVSVSLGYAWKIIESEQHCQDYYLQCVQIFRAGEREKQVQRSSNIAALRQRRELVAASVQCENS